MRERLLSLDVLRGLTVALMILVNNPGSWAHLYPPLAHAAWHGCTPTDLVFPFFLFTTGAALAWIWPGLGQVPPGAFAWRVGRRVLVIFGIGLLLNASPFVRWGPEGELALRSVEQLRLMGVLQRIALAWGMAALALRLCGDRSALPLAVLLLLGYWAACVAWGMPADPYSLEGWFGTALDRAVLGAAHLYRGDGGPFDPEGLASTVPAVAQVLLGAHVGRMLRAGQAGSPIDAEAAWRSLLGLALACGTLGWLWSYAMPVNKKIWTGPYVLLSTAGAVCMLMALVARLDLPAQRHGSRPRVLQAVTRLGEVFGRNALFIFVLSGLVPRVLQLLRWPLATDASGRVLYTHPGDWVWRSVFEPLAVDPRLSSLLFALVQLAGYATLAFWMDRRRLYIHV